MNKSPIACVAALHPILQQYKRMTWVEIGVSKGVTAEFVLTTFDVKKAVLIDPYCPCTLMKESPESRKQAALTLLTPHAKKIAWHFKYSTECINALEDSSVDVLFVDGNHSEKDVLQDLTLYTRKLRVGGLVICDDFNEVGVKAAVNLFTRERKIGYTVSDYRTSRKHPLQIAWWHHA